MTPTVADGLWVIEMCQCVCSSVVTSVTALVGDAGYKGGCVSGGGGVGV